MKLTKKQVLHVAKLSNLTLTPSEVDKFSKELSKIVDFINILNDVDTKNVKPILQTFEIKNVLRDDKVKAENILTQDEALSGTDNTKNGLFKVGAILGNRSSM